MVLVLPVAYISAADAGGTTGGREAGGVTDGQSQPIPLHNPLDKGGIRDIPALIAALLRLIVKIGGYIAVIFIVWSGFLFVSAQGNEKKLEDAKRAFFYTIIGVGILLAAEAISIGLANTINNIVG